jgi:hypothetical protein
MIPCAKRPGVRRSAPPWIVKKFDLFAVLTKFRAAQSAALQGRSAARKKEGEKYEEFGSVFDGWSGLFWRECGDKII